jgi:hypothetical protein
MALGAEQYNGSCGGKKWRKDNTAKAAAATTETVAPPKSIRSPGRSIPFTVTTMPPNNNERRRAANTSNGIVVPL